MLVVIPYYAHGTQGHELQIAIKGWNKFCTSDYHIVIAGETDPNIDDPHCEFFYSKRVDAVEDSYRPHLDYVHIFKALRHKFPKEDGFVWAADDNYPVKPFDEAWLKRLRYLTDRPFYLPCGDGWALDKYFTQCKLQDLGIKYRSWTTHVPCWFDFDKLISMFEKFDMEHHSYVIEDMYFNLYHRNDAADLCGLTSFFVANTDDIYDVEANIEQRMWICNSVGGWSEDLENILNNHYGRE